MIEYPLLTTLKGKKVHIPGRAQLLAHYDEIFDTEVRCAVQKARSDDVWGNYQGFTIKLGEIWFDAIIPRGEKVNSDAPDFWTNYSFKVSTVNNGSPISDCAK